MDQLIWFSIPGAVFLFAVASIFPTSFNTEPKIIILVASVPVVGFIIHQTFRLIFELTGGFARKSRKVLAYLSTRFSEHEGSRIDNVKAFLIWETTFYSSKFPAAFRDHDRGSWHYILSFWSICASALIAGVFCVVFFFVTRQVNLLWVGIGEFAIALIFWLKGNTSYRSLNNQEVWVVRSNYELFAETKAANIEPFLPHSTQSTAET